mmetsp:Transcript_9096/g.19725  ORF Transcript_9096/g.19725 Transcript_9096/m.19725 type:complete len:209 (-) Transcript_9096:24-650(-)
MQLLQHRKVRVPSSGIWQQRRNDERPVVHQRAERMAGTSADLASQTRRRIGLSVSGTRFSRASSTASCFATSARMSAAFDGLLAPLRAAPVSAGSLPATACAAAASMALRTEPGCACGSSGKALTRVDDGACTTDEMSASSFLKWLRLWRGEARAGRLRGGVGSNASCASFSLDRYLCASTAVFSSFSPARTFRSATLITCGCWPCRS